MVSTHRGVLSFPSSIWPRVTTTPPLIKASQNGQTEIVRELLAQGAYITSSTKRGVTTGRDQLTPFGIETYSRMLQEFERFVAD